MQLLCDYGAPARQPVLAATGRS